MEIQAQKLGLPTNVIRLKETILSLLQLPKLQELRITSDAIEVKRGVEDDDEVIPESLVESSKGMEPPDPDVPFLLSRIQLEQLPIEPERHQLTTLIQMTALVREQGLHCSAWFVAQGDGLDSFLGQQEGTLPSELFGIPVYYVAGDHLPDGRLLLIGSRTRYSIDALYGVVADIGG